MRTQPRAELERLLAYRQAQFEAATTRSEPCAHGTAYLTPEHPTKWDVNLLHVHDGTGLDAATLMAEADRLLGAAGLNHRKIEFARGGEAMRPDFEAAGWAVEDFLLMIWRGDDRRGDTPPIRVREVGFPAVRPLTERWYGEHLDPDASRALADADVGIVTALGARGFLVECDRMPAAYCLLLRGQDGIGEIDQVYTAAEHRGSGFASAVVRAAMDAAVERGDDLIFLVADNADWPQVLYERLGFEVVGTRLGFTRKPPGA